MTATINIGSGPTATLLVSAGDGPTLIVNSDQNNTVWIGDTDAIRPADPTGVVPLGPTGSYSVTGDQDVYGVTDPGITVSVYVLAGGTSFFQPPNLAAIGGASVFVQPTAPPVTAAPNSLWFNTSTDGLEILQSGAWTPQQLSGQELILAATIFSSEVANGTLTTTQLAVAAGILGAQIAENTVTGGATGNLALATITAANIVANTITTNLLVANFFQGYEIDGAIFRAKNSFGATIMTINKTAATWCQYADTGSAAQGMLIASSANSNTSDEFGNGVFGGTTNYFLNSSNSTYYASNIFEGSVNFFDNPNPTDAPNLWNEYSNFEPNTATGEMIYIDNIGNPYNIGHRENSAAVNQLINSTSATDITGAVLGGLGASSYHAFWDIFYSGANSAGTAVFNLAQEGGAVVGFGIAEFQFKVSGGMTTRINVNAANFSNTQASGTLVAGAMQHATIETWFTLSTGGNINVAAREGTSGDSFTINAIFGRIEKRQ